MLFNKTFELEKVKKNTPVVNYRKAVRGIIYKDRKILLVKTKNNEYKFPGGGVKYNEKLEDALMREIKEETGYSCTSIVKKIGITKERSFDRRYNNKAFEMVSYYYLASVNDIAGEQKLERYEMELNFEPVWLSIEDALFNNKIIIDSKSPHKPSWIKRECYVLSKLLEFNKSL